MMYCKQDAVTLQKDPNWADWVVDGKLYLYIFCKALQPLFTPHSKPQSFRCNQRNCFICTAKVEITINLNEKAEVKDTKVRKQSGKNLTHFCFFFLSS